MSSILRFIVDMTIFSTIVAQSQCPSFGLINLVIPTTVSSIKSEAYFKCGTIISLVVSSTLTYIGKNNL